MAEKPHSIGTIAHDLIAWGVDPETIKSGLRALGNLVGLSPEDHHTVEDEVDEAYEGEENDLGEKVYSPDSLLF